MSLRGNADNYYITKEYLGGGAFGAVWKGRRESDDHPVAIKVLIDREDVMETIEEEVKLLSVLSKFPECFPQIVCIYDFIKEAHRCCIVMELLQGESLRSINAHQVPYALEQIATGLSHMHKNKIIHRDIKPENIIVLEDRIVIVDLGLGCSPDFAPDCENDAGTPLYMDPLFRLGKIRTSQYASDIFALGVTMYNVITGDEANYIDFDTRDLLTEEYIRLKSRLDLFTDEIPFYVINTVKLMLHPLSIWERPTADEIIEMLKPSREDLQRMREDGMATPRLHRPDRPLSREASVDPFVSPPTSERGSTRGSTGPLRDERSAESQFREMMASYRRSRGSERILNSPPRASLNREYLLSREAERLGDEDSARESLRSRGV